MSTALRRVPVALGGRSYEIVAGTGVLSRAGEFFLPLKRGKRAILVADEAVPSAVLEALTGSLAGAGLETIVLRHVSGEEAKAPEHLFRLWERMVSHGTNRDDVLWAVGGGVTGDLAGFAAATFHRGLAFVQVPTTLLAMVDSSIGGKTGINVAGVKNVAGAFWQPKLVLADLDAMASLPDRAFRAGFAEIVKAALLADAEFFAYLERHAEALGAREPKFLTETIARACEIKAAIVARDEREGGARALLNVGHTIGHALEALSYEPGAKALSHGEAVSLGMVAEAKIAERLPLDWHVGETARLAALLRRFALPTAPEPAGDGFVDAVLALTRQDKKARHGRARYALPKSVGECVWDVEVEESLVRDVLSGWIPRS